MLNISYSDNANFILSSLLHVIKNAAQKLFSRNLSCQFDNASNNKICNVASGLFGYLISEEVFYNVSFNYIILLSIYHHGSHDEWGLWDTYFQEYNIWPHQPEKKKKNTHWLGKCLFLYIQCIFQKKKRKKICYELLVACKYFENSHVSAQ